MPSSSSSWMKELGRLMDGLSLVAKEAVAAKQSSHYGHGHSLGDLQSLMKKALLSFTDISGLTKGKVRQFSVPIPPNNNINPAATAATYNASRGYNKDKESSVVYFLDTSSNSKEKEHPDEGGHISHDPQAQARGEVQVQFIVSDSSQDDASPTSALKKEGNNFSSSEGGGGESAAASAASAPPPPTLPPSSLKRKRKPREITVPSTSFSRALGFASLGAGLAWGTIQESSKRLVFGTSNSHKQSALSPYLSEKNAERLALALCRMRGAALKLGQMLSIQDESLVPAPILAALDIVRQGADLMPRSQLNQVLDAELGPDWSTKLMSFDYQPMAAASIGQVHRAVTKDGLEVAMKIQYPGVADSIESDIKNVKLLLKYTNLIPETMYLDNAMKVAKDELSRECDYELEAANQKRFRNLLSSTNGFHVPIVVDYISSKRVLTSELVPGIPIDKVALLDQETRNYVGGKLLELTLTELFVFRFMQTDPNWSNFLYDGASRSINLIDFGAARDYPKSFVDDYLRMVLACANSDREAVIEMSERLGFLTGMESEIMLEAHIQAAFVVGLPFSKAGGYDFRSTNIAQSISNLGATMLRHRLTPPPEEAYSLHRKLSGAFLACIKLGAVVPCRELLLHLHESYQFGEDGKISSTGSNSQ